MIISTRMAGPHWIVTGADAHHFANSRLLVASWCDTNRSLPLAFCDFGLTEDQRRAVQLWPVTLLDIPTLLSSATHGWRRKAGLIHYVEALKWETLTWIDADAMLLVELGNTGALLDGYDLAIDAHPMAIGEIVSAEAATRLPTMDPRDAYFSSGFWLTSSGTLLRAWDELCSRVTGVGELWENDAFVAAVYSTRARVRTLCGNIWHVRGRTSIETAEVVNGRLTFAGFECVVLHANAGYVVRKDGRRVFLRKPLQAIQDHFEHRFCELRKEGFRA